jgi:hypothetical protein
MTGGLMRQVYIGLLAHDGKNVSQTTLSLLTAQSEVLSLGCNVLHNFVVGCALQDHARNAMCWDFLNTGHDDMIMVDSDVSWQSGCVAKLLSYPVDVVAGVYRKRLEPEEYAVRWRYDQQFLVGDPETGLLEVEAVPAGFMRITRNCLLKMTEHYKDRAYTDDLYGGRKTIDLWNYGVTERRLWGEDFAFCKRWRDIGGKVWVDPDMDLGHSGLWTFQGNLGKWLRSRPGFEESKEQCVREAAE